MSTGQPDFITLREDWNIYRLKNGTIIKSKNSLALFKVPEVAPSGQLSGGDIRLSPSHVVVAGQEDIGTPSIDQTIQPEDQVGEVEFDTIANPVNVYDFSTQGTIILTRMHMKRITKTTKFDINSIRIYQMNLFMSLAILPYPPEPSVPITVK